MDDGGIAFTPEAFEMACVKGIEAGSGMVSGGNKVQVVENGTAAHSSFFSFVKGPEHLLLG